MNRSQFLIEKSLAFFSEAHKKFKLHKPIVGVSFDSNKVVKLPAGEYVVIEDDSRDTSRAIVANRSTQDLYALNKKMIK